MTSICTRCGNDKNVGKFCPACGAAQESAAPANPEDPFIGTVLADRYEIQELLAAGGMGRVYRAKQTLLDRVVAVKVIHPHLLTTEQIVARFLAEARTASKLNHPNVVSIFDFGKTSAAAGNHLYLVMELLAGRSLAAMIEKGEPLSNRRIARIMRQALAALGEAHALGITHRDVKSENVIVDTKRGDYDVVKVIDFGIATAAGDQRHTQAGQLLGTPHYMAPEILSGKVGPSIDLYAAGIMLFELVTGTVPFDDETVSAILVKHTSAPRPDPREVAPSRNIPEALAKVCLQAIDIDPEKRFPDAETFAEAIEAAVMTTSKPDIRHSVRPVERTTGSPAVRLSNMPTQAAPVDSTPPRMRSTPDPRTAGAPVPSRRDSTGDVVIEFGEEESLAKTVPPPPLAAAPKPISNRPPQRPVGPPRKIDAGGLVGRDELLAEVWQWIETVPGRGHVLWGRRGSGRTVLLDRLVREAGRQKIATVVVPALPEPFDELGFSGLRAIVNALIGAKPESNTPPSQIQDRTLAAQWRLAFGIEPLAAAAPLTLAERSCTGLLRWAIQERIARAKGERVLLVLDDVDALDGSSRGAVEAILCDTPIAGLTVLMTSESAPDPAIEGRIQATQVEGLAKPAAVQYLRAAGTKMALPRDDDFVEPLYLQQLARWSEAFAGQPAPRTLDAVIEWRLRALPSAQRRVMQAIALLGSTTRDEIRGVLADPTDVDGAVNELKNAGFVRCEDTTIQPLHRSFARVSLEIAPADLRAEMHRRAARTLGSRPHGIELRAFHGMRAGIDESQFMLLAQAGELRLARGDHAGVVTLLSEAIKAARAEVLRGDSDAAQIAWVRYAIMLGESLLALDRPTEALGLLDEALGLAAPGTSARALVMHQLALIAAKRGKPSEAEKWRKDAVLTAEQSGHASVIERVRSMDAPIGTGKHKKAVFGPAAKSIPPGTAQSGRSR